MNKIKNFFVCSALALLPMCVNAGISDNFTDLHKANKKLVNNALVNIYDKGNTFYNELNFDSVLKSKELKLLNANYIATLNNEILDSVDFTSELGFGYRKLFSKYGNTKVDFNIADFGLKMYLSYNISESRSIRNAINFGTLIHDSIMFKNKDKFDFNEIDMVAFTQYYLRMKFGVFRTENSVTIAYNHNFLRNMKDVSGKLLLDKYNGNYFDALLKTKTGLEFETNLLDFRAFFVASYNTRINKKNDDVVSIKGNKNLTVEYKDRLNVGLEGEVIAGVFGIKVNADYDLVRKDFYYGLNANMKF